jgi:hypothetical protein
VTNNNKFIDTEKFIDVIIADIGVFFVGGYLLMLLSEQVVHGVFNHPGLGYWASAWIIILARWIVRGIIRDKGMVD